ncbi:unnamed protein product [Menidia menidia]|uniref:(Atlantic silverside) hypothetical protein n=1 Tax=Menidia menidia TaxID=238744 RepID=A0A8S4BWM7_9TELE|nr:unnamed protein product [Menidia menidia]
MVPRTGLASPHHLPEFKEAACQHSDAGVFFCWMPESRVSVLPADHLTPQRSAGGHRTFSTPAETELACPPSNAASSFRTSFCLEPQTPSPNPIPSSSQ